MFTSLYKILLGLTLAGLLSSCTTQPDTAIADPAINIAYENITRGNYSNISRARQLIIMDKHDWLSFWRIHSGNQKLRRPRINFDRDMVIAVFAGQQPSDGYGLEVESVSKKDEIITVEFSFHVPPDNAAVSLTPTQPYIIIKIPRHDGQIKFNYRRDE